MIKLPPPDSKVRRHAEPEQEDAVSSSMTSTSRVEISKTATARQTARLEGKFQADLIHDVLVRAGANVVGSSTHAVIGDPKLVHSEVTKTEDGRVVVEDTIELTLTIKSRRELEAFAQLLDRARVEGGELTMKPVQHDVVMTEGAS